ncbi:MAG TPA: adenylyl-sulfate kinase [Bryobacteraceae bacterium]|nr:adenylyl-sulfate kinase [Bryobacteraceae bacterium]
MQDRTITKFPGRDDAHPTPVPAEVDPILPRQDPGMAIWFTGLSSAGKTTIAREVQRRLAAERLRTELLDGDSLRENLCGDLGFSKRDRDTNIRRIGFVAELLARNGVIVLVAAISPYQALREEVRSKIERFAEVYVNAPLAVCEQRDVKGLYKKARSGELRNLTGVDDPYEAPQWPDLECCTDRESVSECAGKVMSLILAWRR